MGFLLKSNYQQGLLIDIHGHGCQVSSGAEVYLNTDITGFMCYLNIEPVFYQNTA
jgi:hypothetical protein